MVALLVGAGAGSAQIAIPLASPAVVDSARSAQLEALQQADNARKAAIAAAGQKESAAAVRQEGRTAITAAPLAEPDMRAEKKLETALERFTGRVSWGWLPVLSPEAAQAFWAQSGVKALASGAVLFEKDVIGANLEVISDCVGVLRLGLGLSAAGSTKTGDSSTPADTGQLAALARLADAGGTVRLTAAFPVLYRHVEKYKSTWSLMLSGGAGTDAPKAGGFLENPPFTGQVGAELVFQQGGAESKLDFEFGITGRQYFYNDVYREKTAATTNSGFLLVPRVALVVLGSTKLNVLFRAARTGGFDNLGKMAITLEQVAR